MGLWGGRIHEDWRYRPRLWRCVVCGVTQWSEGRYAPKHCHARMELAEQETS